MNQRHDSFKVTLADLLYRRSALSKHYCFLLRVKFNDIVQSVAMVFKVIIPQNIYVSTVYQIIDNLASGS